MKARHELQLDVSELEPPEPLQRILARLPYLASGQFLHVRHRREPLPLYAMLQEQGFDYRVIPVAETEFHVLIWYRGDSDVASFCQRYELP